MRMATANKTTPTTSVVRIAERSNCGWLERVCRRDVERREEPELPLERVLLLFRLLVDVLRERVLELRLPELRPLELRPLELRPLLRLELFLVVRLVIAQMFSSSPPLYHNFP
ncbi:MAG: hypothetical protein JXA89_05155 [Anaerolineae bacterium]|nr:hypothetical protein [Anaerolineae bacterium]